MIIRLNMSYLIKQLPNQRWGIYAENKLLATIGCHDTCLQVLELLKTRRRESIDTVPPSTLIIEQAA